jgi:hypothetical protein
VGDDVTSAPRTRSRIIDGAVADLSSPMSRKKWQNPCSAIGGRRLRRNHDSADFAAPLTELLAGEPAEE